MDLENKIIHEAIKEIQIAGIKFTMENLAKRLKMSKKTLYVYFKNKEDILDRIITTSFDSVHSQQKSIFEKDDLTYYQKLKQMLTVVPTYYEILDYRKCFELKQFYPRLYHLVNEKFSEGWEHTINVIQDGMKHNEFKKINVIILKEILLSSMRRMLSDDFLIVNHISYKDAFSELATIILEGIKED